jgi:fatty acid desaturase
LQADNWRRYYWDLSVLGSTTWRVTHALSHHLFVNTYQDFEVSILLPVIEFLPVPDKSFLHKRIAPIFCHVAFFLTPLLELRNKVTRLVTTFRLNPEEAIPLVQLAALCLGSENWIKGVLFFLIMQVSNNVGSKENYTLSMLSFSYQCTATYWLAFTSLISTHHTPLVYHAGDHPHPSSRDWGLHQLDTVRDTDKSSSLLFAATTFGNHVLHHLFPTVDQSKLEHLYPALLETCRQFGVSYTFMGHFDGLKGLHKQMASEKPSTFEERENARQ